MSREMKDSGVEWIGEIPEDWNIERCKYNFAYHKNIAGMNSVNYKRLALTMRGVVKRDKEDTDGLQPESFDGYQIANEEDLIFKLIDLAGKSTSRVGLSPYTGLVSPAYILLHANDKKMNKEYAQYFFLSMWYRLIFNQIGNGGIRSSLNATDLLEVPITTPKLTEQQQIVHFLDRKCTAIDTAIEKTKKSIEKLEEYKKAVITKAVTKGIDPNAKMKDSGIEWIGEIPEEWEVSKFKFHTKQKNDRNPGDATVLSLYREHGVVIKDSRDDNYNRTSLDTSTYRYVEVDDFVVNKMKAWQGSVAVSNYVGVVSPAYFVYKITNKNIYPLYFHHLMRGCYKDEFMRLSGGIRIGQWDLPADALGNTLILIPPYTEQVEIANFLDRKCVAIDTAIEKKKTAITKWEEYKKSLIYYVVTGKIDCRNEART